MRRNRGGRSEFMGANQLRMVIALPIDEAGARETIRGRDIIPAPATLAPARAFRRAQTNTKSWLVRLET